MAGFSATPQTRVLCMGADEDSAIQQELARLSSRIASLEAQVASLEGRQPAPPPQQPAPKATAFLRRLASTDRPGASLESRIGGQILNRIGILAVLVGTAWFLKLAFDRNWIGPLVRIWIGLAASAALMVWSERFRRGGFSAFAYSLKALGTSIAYLSLWASWSVFHLAPPWLIFLAMTGVTCINAVLARRQDSELLGLYALAGGLATPLLLSMGQSEIELFCYLALLNAGSLLLLTFHPWKRMAWASLLGTAFYYLPWCWIHSEPSRIFSTTLFLGLFFAGFSLVPYLRKEISTVAFPIVNAVSTWLALMFLYGSRQESSWRPWVTAAMAIACVALAAVSRSSRAGLWHTYLGLATFFVTVAVPLEFHGTNIILCWLCESLILVVLARSGAPSVVRISAAAVLTLIGWALLADWIGGAPRPVPVLMNKHLLTSMAAAIVFAAIALLSLGESQRVRAGWKYLATFSSIAFSLTLLVAVSLEIHHYCFCGAGFFQDFCGAYGQLERRTSSASWGYSAWSMAYGAGLMSIGFMRRIAFLRWQALIVLGLSIANVFLNGVSQEAQGYRVLSFLALGVLLLAVSF